MTILPNEMRPGMGLIRFDQKGTRKPRRGASTTKTGSAKRPPGPCAARASLPQNDPILPGKEDGNTGSVQGHQSLALDCFDQMDLSSIDTWAAECHEDWLVPASPTCSSLPTMHLSDDYLLDSLSIGLGGQRYLADLAPSIDAIHTITNEDGMAQFMQVSELSWQHEPDTASTSLAPSTTCAATPSPLPALADERLQGLDRRLLPSHALYQVASKAPTALPSSSPQHAGEDRAESDHHKAQVGRPRATTQETGASAPEPCSRTGAMLKRTSVAPTRMKRHSTPVTSSAQLPSPDATEQASQRGMISPGAPPMPPAQLAASTPDTTTNGQRNAVEVDVITSTSSHPQLGAKLPAGQRKRRYGDSDAVSDAREDGRGVGAAKRPRLQVDHNSVTVHGIDRSVAKDWLERSSSTSEDELCNMAATQPFRQRLTHAPVRNSKARRHEATSASPSAQRPTRPQSRKDPQPRGEIGNMHDHRRSHPRTTCAQNLSVPTLPIKASKHPTLGRVEGCRTSKNDPSSSANCSRTASGKSFLCSSPNERERSPTEACRACGFRTAHLVQLVDMAWKWVPKDDSLFDALFEGSTGISDAGKSAVMLRLCLGSVREYVREMATVGERSVQPMAVFPRCGETKRTDSVASDSDSFSDDDGDDGNSDLSEGAESNGESDIVDGLGSKWGDQVGGRRVRWSPLEEQRLRSWVKEDKDWPWMAARLGRTEAAVAQHWRLMN